MIAQCRYCGSKRGSAMETKGGLGCDTISLCHGDAGNAELLALPKSGHALPIERAHEVGARLAPFFQGAQG